VRSGDAKRQEMAAVTVAVLGSKVIVHDRLSGAFMAEASPQFQKDVPFLFDVPKKHGIVVTL
jgi:hypothetical protein